MFWYVEKHVQSTLRRGRERTPLRLSVKTARSRMQETKQYTDLYSEKGTSKAHLPRESRALVVTPMKHMTHDQFTPSFIDYLMNNNSLQMHFDRVHR